MSLNNMADAEEPRGLLYATIISDPYQYYFAIMRFFADLHIHSSYSRATSSELTFEMLNAWGRIKGIGLIGSGDCLHPAWFEACRTKLCDDGSGLFSLKPEFVAATEHLVPHSCSPMVRFMLTTEVSSIYKKDGKVRKVHNVICLPSLTAVERLIVRLERIGNLKSDGRPILGLDSRNLLEIALECDERSMLIPAHIWTPWFSALGSKSGFDSIQECFGDLSNHIYAVETGLSSDPPMNWRLSSLDPFALVSSSDAHSPSKLGRECTIFETDLTYDAIYKALADPEDPGLAGTIEFFPEEGKYHVDGHRKCGVRFSPGETIEHHGLCPKCGDPLTIGVLSRVEELADRPEGVKAPRAKPYKSLIPLCEVLAEALGSGPSTKAVTGLYERLTHEFGGEFTILLDTDIASIATVAGAIVAEGIRRMRAGELTIAAGYDGEFGTVHLFTEAERHALTGQESLFGAPVPQKKQRTSTKALAPRQKKTPRDDVPDGAGAPVPACEEDPFLARLNAAQKEAVLYEGKRLIITAGPGTGKTHTITRRIARLAAGLGPGQKCLALTFTNKAAAELHERLGAFGPTVASNVYAGTIHSFCLMLLRQHAEKAGLTPGFEVASADAVDRIVAMLWPDLSPKGRRERLEAMARTRAAGRADDATGWVEAYEAALRAANLLDFDTILTLCRDLLYTHIAVLAAVRQVYPFLFVDEYQDINPIQRSLLLLLAGDDGSITVIGDPNQSIYAFRGSDVAFFYSFTNDFPGAERRALTENYRTAPAILNAFGVLISDAKNQPLIAVRREHGSVFVHEAESAAAEAEFVAHSIERLIGGTSMFSRDSGRVDGRHEGEFSFSDIAVLYRMNALRHEVEQAFERNGIPCIVTGERPFHAHPAAAETLALLSLAAGKPVAGDTLMAILESTIAGWSQKMLEQLRMVLTFTTATCDRESLRAIFSSASLTAECARSAASFFNAIEAVGDLLAAGSIEQAVALCATCSPWSAKRETSPEIRELFSRLLRMARVSRSFEEFMDTVLISREEEGTWTTAEAVTLSTLHAAKGLEWPVVFIIGCEEGIIPLSREGVLTDLEEERRLLYVGMSRPKDRLYLTHAACRYFRGEKHPCRPSPFLREISSALETVDAAISRKKRVQPPDGVQLSLF